MGSAWAPSRAGGTIRRNTFHDSIAGIAIANPSGPVFLEDNLVRDNAVGIGVFNG